MLLGPQIENDFNNAKTYKDKAVVLFGKKVGPIIAKGFENIIEENQTIYKSEIIKKFSQSKEFYDKYLRDCDEFDLKTLDEKSKVISDFLLKRIPQEWVQINCNYNRDTSIEDEETERITDDYDVNSIDIRPINFSIHQVYQKYQYDEIDLNPDFQRNEIWSNKQKSLLIESILIRIPIPAFYIDARNPAKWNVIDGLQRLSTIIKFIQGQFRLTELEYLDLKGKTYLDLDRKYQRRIEDYALLFNLVYPGTSNKVAFNIFTRINTLGTSLSAQEIRHAMNDGTSTRLLGKLSKNKNFIKVISQKNHDSMSKRMYDRALILRYLAFNIFGYSQYVSNDMNDFLDKAMKELNKIDDRENSKDIDLLNDYIKDFNNNMIKAYSIFKERAFRKIFDINESKKWPISLPLFETINCALDNYSIEEIENNSQKLFKKFLLLFKDDDFIASITTATNNIDNVKSRFEKVNQLFKEVIGDQ